jgi:hypothetical protein
MTQNLYVGADTTPVFQSPTSAIAAAYNSVLANNFQARAAAIASEAANAGGPLLIGLQEAEIINPPNQPSLDYAQILINALAAKGLNYTEAGTIPKPACTLAFSSARHGSALRTKRSCWRDPTSPVFR